MQLQSHFYDGVNMGILVVLSVTELCTYSPHHLQGLFTHALAPTIIINFQA